MISRYGKLLLIGAIIFLTACTVDATPVSATTPASLKTADVQSSLTPLPPTLITEVPILTTYPASPTPSDERACLETSGDILFTDHVHMDLYSMDKDGMSKKMLQSDIWGPTAWSQDGQKFAIACGSSTRSDICIFDAPKNNQGCTPDKSVVILPTPQNCHQGIGDLESWRINEISWSPTGNQLAITCRPQKAVLCFLSLDGETQCWSDEKAKHAIYVNWSPVDPEKLAISDGKKVYLSSPTGENLSYLVNGTKPTWSPDGSKIAFIDEAKTKVLTFELLDKNIVELYISPVKIDCSETGSDCFLTWAPDQKYIIFSTSSSTPFSFNLIRVNLETGEAVVIDHTDKIDTNTISPVFPAWRP